MTLVTSYLPERKDRAIRLLTDCTEMADDPSPVAIVRLLDLLRREPGPRAFQLVDRFKKTLLVPAFHVAWAKLVVWHNSGDMAEKLLRDQSFRVDAVRTMDPSTMYKVLKLADDETADEFLREALEGAAEAENIGQLRSMAEIFVDLGEVKDGIAALRPHQRGKLIDAEGEEAERDKDFTLLKRQRCENFEAR